MLLFLSVLVFSTLYTYTLDHLIFVVKVSKSTFICKRNNHFSADAA